MNSTPTLGELEADLEALRLEKSAREEELRMNPNLTMERPARYRFLKNRVERLTQQIDKVTKAKRSHADYLEWDRKTREASR
jgi:hypothetical protein